MTPATVSSPRTFSVSGTPDHMASYCPALGKRVRYPSTVEPSALVTLVAEKEAQGGHLGVGRRTSSAVRP